jgi:hydrogenase maturation factor
VTAPIPVGKLPTRLLTELLAAAPRGDESVRLGPAIGEDAAAVDVPAGTLVAATDPITLTGQDAGRYAVIINANDVAVTGAAPRWFLVTVLLPPGTTETVVRELFDAMTTTAARLDITVVGGHTEVTTAVSRPVLVGQMLGTVAPERLVTTSGAGPGDVLVQVGPAPVEGAAVLAAEAGDEPLRGVDPHVLDAARRATEDPGIAVVDAALLAADLGATSMHDPTEGGLAAALHEVATAADVTLTVDPTAVLWFPPGQIVCEAVRADPWATLASGCLLATFAAERGEAAVAALRETGHQAAIIGGVTEGSGVRVGHRDLPWPARDEVARLLGG